MKNVMIVFVLMLMSLPVFAQRYRHPKQCQAAAIDRYNRIIATFWGPGNPNGRCHQALRICDMEVRRRGWYDARCVQLRSRW
jgi:hypothetical protein